MPCPHSFQSVRNYLIEMPRKKTTPAKGRDLRLLSAKVDLETHRRMRVASAWHDIPMSELLRRFLTDGLARDELARSE